MTGILMMAAGNSYGSAPVNTVAPAVTGTAQVRQTLSCSTGTWTGAPAPTFTYQWQSNSSNISGATSSTYQIVDAYVGTAIRCVVTATNSVAPGGVSANSNATSSVTANVPAAPTIGTATAASATTASVTFTAPTGPLATGGSAITGYTVYSSGGQSASGSSSPITVTGLNSESSYNFYVRANNAVGQSANSGTSNTITTPASYWIALVNYGWSGASAARGNADSNGATVIVGGNGYGGWPAARLSKEGAITASTAMSTNNYIYPSAINVNMYGDDGSRAAWGSTDGGALYGGGWTSGLGGSGNPAGLTRVDASGNVSWYNGNQWNSSLLAYWVDVREGPDGYIYAAGGRDGRVGLYGKFATNGTTQWLRYNYSSNSCGVTTTTDGTNFYFFWNQFSSGSYNRAYYCKTSSDGLTVTWCKYLSASNESSYGASFKSAVYSGGYIYAAGSSYTSGVGYTACLWKINPSDGSLVWSRSVKDSNQTNFASDVYVGPDGYIYFCAVNANANRTLITKLDTNGNAAWQRVLYVSSGSATLNGTRGGYVSVSGSTLYVTQSWNIPNFAPFLMKVPSDGSKTGSYTASSVSTTYVWTSFSEWGDPSSFITYNNVGTGGQVGTWTPNNTYSSGNTAGSAGMALTQLVSIP